MSTHEKLVFLTTVAREFAQCVLFGLLLVAATVLKAHLSGGPLDHSVWGRCLLVFSLPMMWVHLFHLTRSAAARDALGRAFVWVVGFVFGSWYWASMVLMLWPLAADDASIVRHLLIWGATAVVFGGGMARMNRQTTQRDWLAEEVDLEKLAQPRAALKMMWFALLMIAYIFLWAWDLDASSDTALMMFWLVLFPAFIQPPVRHKWAFTPFVWNRLLGTLIALAGYFVLLS